MVETRTKEEVLKDLIIITNDRIEDLRDIIDEQHKKLPLSNQEEKDELEEYIDELHEEKTELQEMLCIASRYLASY